MEWTKVSPEWRTFIEIANEEHANDDQCLAQAGYHQNELVNAKLVGDTSPDATAKVNQKENSTFRVRQSNTYPVIHTNDSHLFFSATKEAVIGLQVVCNRTLAHKLNNIDQLHVQQIFVDFKIV